MKLRSAHTETPYIVGICSVALGLLWATIYVARHEELALAIQILLFVVSPLVGLLGFIVAVSLILLMGFIGDWLDQKLRGRHASHRD